MIRVVIAKKDSLASNAIRPLLLYAVPDAKSTAYVKTMVPVYVMTVGRDCNVSMRTVVTSIAVHTATVWANRVSVWTVSPVIVAKHKAVHPHRVVPIGIAT